MKKVLLGGTVLIMGIQIFHTIVNKVTWPFCSHNFYYHRSDLLKPVFRIGLIDDEGDVRVVDCRETLPIEGYRSGSIYREVFVTNTDPERKRAFAELVLARLNAGGWLSFDERLAPVLPKEGRTFVGLTVERHTLDTREFGETGKLPTVNIEEIYRCLISRTL